MRVEGRPVGRNDRCSCGSGKKYKHCCEGKHQGWGRSQQMLFVLVVIVLVGGLVLAVTTRREPVSGPTGVWSEEHGHYH
jgi:hypothetical protein